MPNKSVQFKVNPNIEAKQVDLKNRVISGVTIAELGLDKDPRSQYITEAFLQEIAALGSGKQIPCEIDHNFHSQVGKKLGYIQNISYADGKVIGDLHIYKSADKSPVLPGMGNFILESIEEDPASYMLSMKLQIEELEEEFKALALTGIDVVPSGALTSSMFSSDSMVDALNAFSDQATFDQFMADNANRLVKFKKYYQKNMKKSFSDFFSLFGSNKEDDDLQKIATLQTTIIDKSTKIEDLESQAAAFSTEKEAFEATIASLTTDLATAHDKIQALESQPLDILPLGNEGDGSGAVESSDYMSHPVNQRALRNFNRIKNKK